MAYEVRELSGSLFKKDDKKEETHADFNGSAKIAGIEYWLNAWIKTYEKEGMKRKYYSLSFKPKVTAKQVQGPSKSADVFNEMDDDIPF